MFVLAKYKFFVFANSSCILQIHVGNKASLVTLLVELLINLRQGLILQLLLPSFLNSHLQRALSLYLWEGPVSYVSGILLREVFPRMLKSWRRKKNYTYRFVDRILFTIFRPIS